ncbi:MAG: tetratricopeptide repeat protein [Anaerolineae bacterium]|nr:tetratricopeptide repeat protein [Anaerolineae bacterium]
MVTYNPQDRLEHFQHREATIEAFDHLWDSPHTWLLTFDGPSGLGKTTLISWLEVNRCQRDQIPYASLSFEYELNYKSLLDAILREFQNQLDLPSYRTWLTKREEILKDRDQRVVSIQADQRQAGSTAIDQTVRAELAEREREIDFQARDRLTVAWLDCLTTLQHPKAAIFLDTFERHQETVSDKDISWLWQTLEKACRRRLGLRVIIGSRVPVHRPEHSGTQQRLEAFSRAYSNQVLLSLGVSDEAFRTAVYDRLAHGHPLVTAYAAEAWLDADKVGKPLTVVEIPELPDHERAIEWIQQQIVDRSHNDDPLKEAVQWAALLRKFNRESLNALLKNKLDEKRFARLTQYSFVEPSGDHLRCHDLLRRVQIRHLQRVQPEVFTERQAVFVDYLAQPQGDPQEALYHRFFANTEQAFSDWCVEHVQARENYDYEQLNKLFAIVESEEIDRCLTQEQKALVRFLRGEQYYFQNNLEKARSTYLAALPLYEAINDPLSKADTLQRLGDLELSLDDSEAARQHFKVALPLYEVINDDLGKANALQRLGDLERLLGNSAAARQHLSAALPLYEAIHSPLGKANTLQSLGDLELYLGNGEAARRHFNAALLLFETVKDSRGKANALKSLGGLELNLGNGEAARQHFNAALPLYETVKDSRGKANTLQSLGNLELRLDNDEAARQYFNAALPLFEAISSPLGVANTLKSLGILELNLGNGEAARQHFNAALILYKAINSPLGKANTLQSLGDLELSLGNDEAARRHFNAALPLYEIIDSPLGKANTLQSLGNLELSLGNNEAARRHFNAALPLYETVKDPMGKMNIYLGLARLEHADNHCRASARYYLMLFELTDTIGFGNHPVTQSIRHEYQQMKNNCRE